MVLRQAVQQLRLDLLQQCYSPAARTSFDGSVSQGDAVNEGRELIINYRL